jgi:HD-like signal output (HDOD) protein
MNPASDTLRQALADIVARGDFAVPPYPAVALRLQRVLARDNYPIHEVADAISADPALAARVLGTANSALYRATEEITTLPRAVNRLGARVLGSIAVAAGVGDSVNQPGVLFDVKYRVWRRTLTAALACQKLATSRGLAPDETFLIGLLHGLGRSVAVASLEALVRTHAPPRPLALSEWLALVEVHRAHLADAVAKRWNLPASIVAALNAAPTTREGALLREAERIAAALENGERPRPENPAEARAVDELIHGLPHALELLAQVPPALPRVGVQVTSDQTLPGDRRPCAVAVNDPRKRGVADLRCLAISPTGFEFDSSRSFQESSIVRLDFGGQGELLPWFNVLRCVPDGARYRVEVALFSPTRELKERWQALFDAA